MANTVQFSLPLILILFTCITFIMAQRSPYVPRPVDYPGVLPRFGSTTAPPPLNNRFGTIGGSSTNGGSRRPSNTLYDQDTVNQVATWPREKQPFWYINAAHIANHHGMRSPNASQQERRNVV